MGVSAMLLRRITGSPSAVWYMANASFLQSPKSAASGIFIGILGIIGMSVNYPVYRKLLAKGKKKYAFEILELVKEISGQ